MSSLTRLLLSLGVLHAGVVFVDSSTVKCELTPTTQDDLLTIEYRVGGKRLHLIVDTGSASTVLFGTHPAGSGHHLRVPFQHSSVDISALDSDPIAGFLACKNTHIPISKPSTLISVKDADTSSSSFKGLDSIAHGIIGLGQEALRVVGGPEPFLFSPHVPAWSTVRISRGRIEFDRRNGLLPLHVMPVVSRLYWATDVMDLYVGAHLIDITGIVAVFDTGSNFFGLSPLLHRAVTNRISASRCSDAINLSMLSLNGSPVRISYEPTDYLAGPGCGNLAIQTILQSGFGDINTREVFIIGTRGLGQRTMGIHKGDPAKSEPGFLISFN